MGMTFKVIFILSVLTVCIDCKARVGRSFGDSYAPARKPALSLNDDELIMLKTLKFFDEQKSMRNGANKQYKRE